MDFNVNDYVREQLQRADAEIEQKLIDTFGSLENALASSHLWVIEEVATPYTRQADGTVTMDVDMTLRLKTEDELRRDRVEDILERNAPIGKCIVCDTWIYKTQSSFLTKHGHYHEECLYGRDEDDSNHY